MLESFPWIVGCVDFAIASGAADVAFPLSAFPGVMDFGDGNHADKLSGLFLR